MTHVCVSMKFLICCEFHNEGGKSFQYSFNFEIPPVRNYSKVYIYIKYHFIEHKNRCSSSSLELIMFETFKLKIHDEWY